MKHVTKAWFSRMGACPDGAEYGAKNLVGLSYPDAIRQCIRDDRLEWANWGIARALGKKNRVKYAIFAAEQAIGLYEKNNAEDKRPREAIEAAKNWLKAPSQKTAASAAYAAASADYAAYAAASAASAASAAYAAASADYAAYAAASASADYAAYAAAYAAYAADYAAKSVFKIKILEYGITLLEETP